MTNTPRTRRQLREALGFEKQMNARLEARAAELRTLLDKIEPKLEADGWKATRQPGIVVVSMSSDKTTYPPAVDWNAPDRVAAEQRVVAQAVKDVRRETLATVIEALEIRGYDAGLTGTIGGSKPLKRHHDTERFWADIQTAIGVREEKRVADERTATEARVAGLGRGQYPLSFVIPADSINLGSIIDSSSASTSRKPTPPTVMSRLGQVVITHSAAQEFSVWASDTQDGPAEKVGDLAVGDSLVVSDQPFDTTRWYFVKAESESGKLPLPSDRVPATVKPLVNTDALSTAAPKKKPAKKKSGDKK